MQDTNGLLLRIYVRLVPRQGHVQQYGTVQLIIGSPESVEKHEICPSGTYLINRAPIFYPCCRWIYGKCLHLVWNVGISDFCSHRNPGIAMCVSILRPTMTPPPRTPPPPPPTPRAPPRMWGWGWDGALRGWGISRISCIYDVSSCSPTI